MQCGCTDYQPVCALTVPSAFQPCRLVRLVSTPTCSSQQCASGCAPVKPVRWCSCSIDTFSPVYSVGGEVLRFKRSCYTNQRTPLEAFKRQTTNNDTKTTLMASLICPRAVSTQHRSMDPCVPRATPASAWNDTEVTRAHTQATTSTVHIQQPSAQPRCLQDIARAPRRNTSTTSTTTPTPPPPHTHTIVA